MREIYYIAAKSLMRWTPDVREQILDKLTPFERECVRGWCARINEKTESSTIQLQTKRA